jgi:twinkle protein
LATHRDALYEIYENGFSPGVSTGWPEFDSLWRPIPGELVIVTGYPGHGKTSWLNHLLVNLAHINRWNIGLYSPEQGIEGEMLGKFVQIASTKPYLPSDPRRMSREELDFTIDWVGEHFWEVYAEGKDDQGFASLTVPQILHNTEPLALKQDLRALVIDPWNECESARPKHMSVEEYISTSLSTIRSWNKRNEVSTMVVIHPRKPDSIKTAEDSAPRPFEAAGAAHWYNKADIFLTVHRDKKGDRGGTTIVEVAKHRREGITGDRGAVEFKYDRNTGRFHEMGTYVPDGVGYDSYVDLPEGLVQSWVVEPQEEPQLSLIDI